LRNGMKSASIADAPLISILVTPFKTPGAKYVKIFVVTNARPAL
jgi:hypothetical protein